MMAGPGSAALRALLEDVLPGTAPIRIARIAGGQSNPTYLVTRGPARIVLRHPPPGRALESAHAIDREYRIMSALANSGVPVPRMLHWEARAGIIGTPFYLMEHLDGDAIHDSALPGRDPTARAGIYADMARVLARLHLVDWRSRGLGDFGREGGYFARQIRRWTRQWTLCQFRGIPEIDQLSHWLAANLPPDRETVIVHGDYRLGNLIIDKARPKVRGVLDWELATLGHPLADLAHAAMFWLIRPEEYGGLLGRDLAGTGIPTRSNFERAYLAAAGRSDGLTRFHLAFALFRFAVIFEGIAARVQSGQAAGADAAEKSDLSIAFARRATALLGHDRDPETLASEIR